MYFLPSILFTIASLDDPSPAAANDSELKSMEQSPIKVTTLVTINFIVEVTIQFNCNPRREL